MKIILSLVLLTALACAGCARKESPISQPTEVLEVSEQSHSAPSSESSTMVAEVSVAEAQNAFERTLELQGFVFHVLSGNNSSINTLTITVSGLDAEISPIMQEVDGIVTGAEVGDLDANGEPEIYVYVNSVGSGSYGSLMAHAVNSRRSVTPIYLPPLTDNPEVVTGYMGHDEFAVGEGRLLQRFPIYHSGDTNSNPTGGTRQLQHQLVAGEAGWILRIDQIVEY